MGVVTEVATPARRRLGVHAGHHHYKWWALSCTSLGMLLATINSGTLIIALPDLERALHTTILQLVWVILAYMIASTVLVLTAGRLSDLFGRKTAYEVGQAPGGEDQHRRGDHVGEDHPDELQDRRVQGALEVRQGDDQRAGVDGGEQHAQARAGKRPPLVVVVACVHAQPTASGS